MIKIYHNPRCRKSREGLELLKENNIAVEIVKYLDDIPTETELKKIINLLGIKPIDLIRKNEAVWKEKYKGKNLIDDELVTAMVDNPKLIERPIIINGNKAVIGRPPEKILDIL